MRKKLTKMLKDDVKKNGAKWKKWLNNAVSEHPPVTSSQLATCLIP